MSDPSPTHDLLKAGDVTKLFQINRTTLSRWEAAGHLTPVRVGKRWVRYRRQDIEAILAKEAS